MDRNSFQVTSNWVYSTRSQRQFTPQQLWCTRITLWNGWHRNDKTKQKLEESSCALSSVKIEMLALKMKNIFVYLKTTHIFFLHRNVFCFFFDLVWFGLNVYYILQTFLPCVTVRIELIKAAKHTKCGYIHVHQMCVLR